MLEQPSLGSKVEPTFFIFLLAELEMARPDLQKSPANIGREVDKRELQEGLASWGEDREVWLEGDEPGEESLVSVRYGEVEYSQPGRVGEVEVCLQTIIRQQSGHLVSPLALALTGRVQKIISCNIQFLNLR